MKTNVRQIFLALLAILFVAQSCKKEDEGTPPEIPPADAAFKISTDDFNNSSKGMANWANAAVHVFVWQTAINLTMVLPVAAYAEAVKNHEPEYIGEQTWEWTYDFTVLVKHSAKLHGTVRGDSVDWKMYISKEGAFENFLWYTGTSAFNGTGGYWDLVKSPTETGNWLHIDWKRNNDETGYIKYSGVKNGSDIYGDYIHAERTGNDLDAKYDIRDASESKDVFIEWSTQFKNGRIKSSKLFSDENWHCWDESLHDVDCAK